MHSDKDYHMRTCKCCASSSGSITGNPSPTCCNNTLGMLVHQCQVCVGLPEINITATTLVHHYGISCNEYVGNQRNPYNSQHKPNRYL